MTEKIATKTKEKKYFLGIGRRKTSTAQVRFYPNGSYNNTVNGKKLEDYFMEKLLQEKVYGPIKLVGMEGKIDITALVRGGGKTGQAEAVRLGIARAIQDYDKELRKTVKVAGYLTRDARKKERKKPGLKRARKSPQWSKR